MYFHGVSCREVMVSTMLNSLHELLPNINLNKQSACLLQGVMPRMYVPLMERPQCGKLNIISHN